MSPSSPMSFFSSFFLKNLPLSTPLLLPSLLLLPVMSFAFFLLLFFFPLCLVSFHFLSVHLFSFCPLQEKYLIMDELLQFYHFQCKFSGLTHSFFTKTTFQTVFEKSLSLLTFSISLWLLFLEGLVSLWLCCVSCGYFVSSWSFCETLVVILCLWTFLVFFVVVLCVCGHKVSLWGYCGCFIVCLCVSFVCLYGRVVSLWSFWVSLC